MNRCSSCGYILPGTWTECRRCGAPVAVVSRVSPGAPVAATRATTASTLSALALAPPPPPIPSPPTSKSLYAQTDFGAPDDALLPGASHQPAGPDTMLPRVEPVFTVAAAPRSRVNGRSIVIGAFVAVCVIGAAFSLIPHGGHKAAAGPVVLAPQSPFAGIPTSLDAIVRIEAESSRHTALEVVISAASPSGAPLTLTQLAGLQPGYQWIAGNQPSTTNTMISITSTAAGDVIAVSGTNREICAYGQWSPTTGSTYVTMDHVTTCAASTAPSTGWSTLAGGSAQDLPGEDGS